MAKKNENQIKYYEIYKFGTSHREEMKDYKNRHIWWILSEVEDYFQRDHYGQARFRSKEEAAGALTRVRADVRYENSLSRGYDSWYTKVWIHECDENGNYLPTRAEANQSLLWAIEKGYCTEEIRKQLLNKYYGKNK